MRPLAPGRTPIHWLLEGIFIVVSVLLGFVITQYGEYREEREMAARMLAGVRAEIEYNRGLLEMYIPIHRSWQQALNRESAGTASAADVVMATRPALPSDARANVPLLRRAAWDTALSTGSLRLIDYDLAAALSEIYGMQDYAAATFTKSFADPSFFDPSVRLPAIRFAQVTMTEMTWAEEMLKELYDKHLPAIRAGAAE